MMARERITRQAEWLGLNRAAAYTLYQPRAQITLRLKTEHANAQESLWHRNKEWATIAPCVASLHIRAYTHFSSLCQVFFSPSVLLYPSALSLFLRHSPPLWAFLLFHWFCYVYLLLHLWNWRHRLTSLLLFNNRSWAFSWTLGYHSPRQSSCVMSIPTNGKIAILLSSVILGEKFPTQLQRKVRSSTQQNVWCSIKGRCNWLKCRSISEQTSFTTVLYSSPRTVSELWPCPRLTLADQ